MKLSERLRMCKSNHTTRVPFDYVLMLREDIDTFADEVKALEAENTKLRETCKLKKGATAWFANYNGYVTEWTCDGCGGLTFYDAEMRPRFCAECGRKVDE